MESGGCFCGAVRYELSSGTVHVALCHCSDCRRSAGAPMVGWAAVPRTELSVEGELTTFQSSELAQRQFCPKCGTGLFYINETVLPGLVDVQIGTLDDPETLVPQAHIQVAERLNWVEGMNALPTFERYPA